MINVKYCILESGWKFKMNDCVHDYIMAGHAFVDAKEGFHHRNGNILTLCEWLNDENHFFWFKLNYINKHLHLGKAFLSLKTENTEFYLPVQFFSPNVHWWAKQAQSRLLKTLTFCIIWTYQFISQRLSLRLYNTHPSWFFPQKWTQIWWLALPN